jgi:hypothetical protein
VPAGPANVKKVIAQMFERTGLEIKELFSRDELADMIDEVVTEPPHTVRFCLKILVVPLLLNLPTHCEINNLMATFT